ncbi:hypothetical protein O181_083997 [Austropuccinia psidii MF-1]|uniref:Uncharacterized protein n=1 Tax=Austropuccinia psidii MF-1 TaxID=1389203 RepID=A0A9Q3FTD2_9BASI|nr:hypothetical protein [Austropuccinia psidii MF-1]
MHQGVMNSWHIHKRFLKEEVIGKYLNGWHPLSLKPQIKKIKLWYNKKREQSKEKAPVASRSKPQASQCPQEAKKKRKKNWKKPYSPSYMIPRIQRNSTKNVVNMSRTWMEFKDKEDKIMRQPSLPKK